MTKRIMLQALTAVLLLAMAPLSRARWYDVSSGRFFTMDAYQGDIENPAGLHKYMYVWDNPVNMVDPTGKWATFIHKMAVKRTLTGLLPDSDLEILCDMQTEVDGLENQKAAKSFMHAMRDGETKQTVEQAKQLANSRVRDLLTKARAAEAAGGAENHLTAIQELGRAMHTLQDSTSPAHHGFQPWYDYTDGEANPHEWMHGGKESIYPGTGSWLETATLRMYNYFKGTESLPSDFFSDLGADGTLDGPKEKIRNFRIPSFDLWLDSGLAGDY